MIPKDQKNINTQTSWYKESNFKNVIDLFNKINYQAAELICQYIHFCISNRIYVESQKQPFPRTCNKLILVCETKYKN